MKNLNQMAFQKKVIRDEYVTEQEINKKVKEMADSFNVKRRSGKPGRW